MAKHLARALFQNAHDCYTKWQVKYHIEDGVTKTDKRKWWKPLLLFFPVVGLIAGAYILVNVFSPSLQSVPFVDQGETTEQRLSAKPGTHGDRIFIPQINVDVAIVTGGDETVLDKGAWHRKPEQGDPIKGGNFVLSAHRFIMGLTPQQTRAKSPFYNIDKLQIGDQLFVDYKGERYGYKIAKKESVKPNQTEIENETENPQLTLYSCTLGGAADGRDVLIAEPLGKVEKLEAATR